MICYKLNFYIVDKIYKKLHKLYLDDVHYELKNKIELIPPCISANNDVVCYCYCLQPEELKPSGYCNFSTYLPSPTIRISFDNKIFYQS